MTATLPWTVDRPRIIEELEQQRIAALMDMRRARNPERKKELLQEVDWCVEQMRRQIRDLEIEQGITLIQQGQP